jgi:hypothetical protein
MLGISRLHITSARACHQAPQQGGRPRSDHY